MNVKNILILSAVFITHSIFSDSIELKNGRVVKNAKIETESDNYIIFTHEDGFAVKLDKQEILKIEKEQSVEPAKKDSQENDKPAKNTGPVKTAGDKPEFIFTQVIANDVIVFGSSIFGERFDRRNNTAYKQFNESWVLGNILNINAPIQHLRTQIIIGNPLVGRTNRDNDYYFQTTAGGSDQTQQLIKTLQTGNLTFDPKSMKRYKDKNGLKDLFIAQSAFEWETKAGTFLTGFFFINTAFYPNNSVIGNFIFGWKLPVLQFLKPTYNGYYRFTGDQGGINQGNSHHRISIEYEFFKGEFFRIKPTVEAGYNYFNNNIDRRSGMTDITSRIQFNLGKFFASLSDVYKPNTYMFDNNNYYPKVGTYADNNANDGRADNPSRVHGLLNQIVVNQIQNLQTYDVVKQSFINHYQQSPILKHNFIVNIGYTLLF